MLTLYADLAGPDLRAVASVEDEAAVLSPLAPTALTTVAVLPPILAQVDPPTVAGLLKLLQHPGMPPSLASPLPTGAVGPPTRAPGKTGVMSLANATPDSKKNSTER